MFFLYAKNKLNYKKMENIPKVVLVTEGHEIQENTVLSEIKLKLQNYQIVYCYCKVPKNSQLLN